MKNNSERSLKSLNVKWLVALVAADGLFAMLFVVPEILNGIGFTQASIWRALTTTVSPVVVLLIVNVLPHDVKSMLVYWKPLGVLPGFHAFTKYGPRDPRIDMAALKKNVGTLPTEPTEQNSKWYKLYKQVSGESEVLEAHKMFLMYRDMAVMSLPLIVLIPFALYLAGASTVALQLAGGLFAVQYFLTALSARWSGIRFVCNVLAVHSTRKIAVTRTSATKKQSA